MTEQILLNQDESALQAVHVLRDKGVTDVREIARQVDLLRSHQRKQGTYSYDGYTESGSAANAKILDSMGRAKDCTVWCVNHYLGLNRDSRVTANAGKILEDFGTGSGTSAMSGGRSRLHDQLEKELAEFVGKESAVLYPTGFTANLGTISALLTKNDLILSDSENHASIIDGCRASRAKILPFQHNNVDDLRAKLARYCERFENVLVLVESAYSMSGDLSPLEDIVELKRKYNFLLYVDEAHTFGFYGEQGRGYCVEKGVTKQVDFIMSTLSKSAATIGGFVAMDSFYQAFITIAARAYVFQACIPPLDAALTLSALEVIRTDPEPAKRLHSNNDYFRASLLERGFNLGDSQSPVIPVFIPDHQALLHITKELYESGIFTVSITYPVVGKDEGRLRFIVNASHNKDDIDRTIEELTTLCKKYDVLS